MSSALYADGGASENDELMQLQADLLGQPVLRSRCPELSALGAAWLAGLAVNRWSTFDELKAMVPERDLFEPVLCDERRTELRNSWRLAVGRTRLQAVR